MPFNPNIPQPNDFLDDDSQPEFLANNKQLDASFKVDHYTFSNATGDNGKHNQVTTPIIVGSAHPTTAATELKAYAMQDTAPFGLLQYSRGISNAVPTPITHLQSSAAPTSIAASSSINVVDFAGLSYAICTLYVMDTSTIPITGGIGCAIVPIFARINPSTLLLEINTGFFTAATYTYGQKLPVNISSDFAIQNTGTILQIKDMTGLGINVIWSLDIHRLTV